MFHWCYQETEALFAAVPFVGYYLRKVHYWWHSLRKHNHQDCTANHDTFQSRLAEAVSHIEPLPNPPANDNQGQEVCGGIDIQPEDAQ